MNVFVLSSCRFCAFSSLSLSRSRFVLHFGEDGAGSGYAVLAHRIEQDKVWFYKHHKEDYNVPGVSLVCALQQNVCLFIYLFISGCCCCKYVRERVCVSMRECSALLHHFLFWNFGKHNTHTSSRCRHANFEHIHHTHTFLIKSW